MHDDFLRVDIDGCGMRGDIIIPEAGAREVGCVGGSETEFAGGWDFQFSLSFWNGDGRGGGNIGGVWR